jgi:GntR family transcriptional repressor for pyruvate dehydrogenase complex
MGPAKKAYKPIKVKRTFEYILDLLREKIISGELKVGDRLPTERELAEMVQVSRNTVRQAYHILNQLGLVDINKGVSGGAVVREPSHRPLTQCLNDLLGLGAMTMEDIAEARLFLEKNIIELAYRHITDADIDMLRSSSEKSLALIQQGRAAHRENFQYHRLLADIAGNPVLKMAYFSVLDLLNFVVETTADLNMSAIIAEEHLEFLDLLRGNDLQSLLKFTEEHIRGSNERLLAISNGKPFLLKW